MARLGVALLLGLAALLWWQREALLARYHELVTIDAGPAPAKTVYRWRDAKGHVQFGDAPPAGVSAERVALRPLTVIKSERPAAKPQQATGPDAPTANASEKPCEQEDPMAQAKCINEQLKARNLAIENMQKSLSQ